MSDNSIQALERVPDAQRSRARGITEQSGATQVQRGVSSAPAAAVAQSAGADAVKISEEAIKAAQGPSRAETQQISALTDALRSMMSEHSGNGNSSGRSPADDGGSSHEQGHLSENQPPTAA